MYSRFPSSDESSDDESSDDTILPNNIKKLKKDIKERIDDLDVKLNNQYVEFENKIKEMVDYELTEKEKEQLVSQVEKVVMENRKQNQYGLTTTQLKNVSKYVSNYLNYSFESFYELLNKKNGELENKIRVLSKKLNLKTREEKLQNLSKTVTSLNKKNGELENKISAMEEKIQNNLYKQIASVFVQNTEKIEKLKTQLQQLNTNEIQNQYQEQTQKIQRTVTIMLNNSNDLLKTDITQALTRASTLINQNNKELREMKNAINNILKQINMADSLLQLNSNTAQAFLKV